MFEEGVLSYYVPNVTVNHVAFNQDVRGRVLPHGLP
jgi:hypothetical protein